MSTPSRNISCFAPRALAVGMATVAVTVSLASAQSLGDVARKEEARRKTVASSGKVYTNDKLKSEPPPSASTPSASTPTPQTATPADKDKPSDKDKPADKGKAAAGGQTPAPGATDGKKDEAYWRTRIQTAREALERAKTFAEALQSRINGLSADFTARDDPAQRNAIANDRQKALAELDRVKKEIDQNTKALADIQDEARRANVPAGWLR
jgi:hypothetical protein